MRADQILTLQLGDELRTLIVGDSSLAAKLTSDLGDILANGYAAPGFKIEAPSGRHGFWLLIGGDGAVIARARTSDAIERSLRRHVAAVCAKSLPANSSPFALRSIVGGDASVLVSPQLLKAQPPVERQLSKHGLAVVDSPFVLVRDGRSVGIRDAAHSVRDDRGHTAMVHDAISIRGLLWMKWGEGAVTPTRGQVAHAFAVAARSGSRDDRLDEGLTMADQVVVELVDGTKQGACLTAARRLLAV